MARKRWTSCIGGDPTPRPRRPRSSSLDLNLPVTSGFEVLAVHEHDAQLMCIPTIVLTTSTRPEGITRCYELGANAYHERPAGFQKLAHVLDTVIEFGGSTSFVCWRRSFYCPTLRDEQMDGVMLHGHIDHPNLLHFSDFR
jgi:DNA-binding response OmpR family regulator